MKYIKDFNKNVAFSNNEIIYILELSEEWGKRNMILSKLINLAKKYINIFNKHDIDFKLYHFIRTDGSNDIDFSFEYDITDLHINDIDKLKLDIKEINVKSIKNNLTTYIIPNNDINLYFFSKKYNL